MGPGRRPGAAILLSAGCIAAGCDPAVEATGESWVYSSESLDVALVQVFEQPTPEASRLRHAVLCRSEATARRWREARDELWPGWALVGRLPDIDRATPLARVQRAALDSASGAARDRLITGDDWIAWQSGTHVDFTFDGCVTWSRFDLAESLPSSDLDLSLAKTRCDTGDCRGIAMELPDAMRIANLEVSPPHVAFTVYSPALTHTGRRHVQSRDGGRTWTVVR